MDRIPDTLLEAERPSYFFNDDDVYVVDVRTLKIIRHIGCKSCEYIGSELHGFKAYPGQMVVKGMQAKHLGVHP
jgi:hypothetical protein